MSSFDLRKCKRVFNAGGGDCFFLAICSALRFLNIDESLCDVDLLRYMAAVHVKYETFVMLKDIWENAVKEKDMPLLLAYSYMAKGHKSLADLQKVMQTSEYWADELAISGIEKGLLMRIHVVRYQNGKIEVVKRIDTIPIHEYTKQIVLLHIADEYAPHYQLLIYDDKPVFTRENMPDFLKEN